MTQALHNFYGDAKIKSKLQIVILSTTFFDTQPIILQNWLAKVASQHNFTYITLSEDVFFKKCLKGKYFQELWQNYRKNRTINFINSLKILPFSRIRIIASANRWLQLIYIKFRLMRLLSKLDNSRCVLWFWHPDLYEILRHLNNSVKPAAVSFDSLDVSPGQKKDFINNPAYYHYVSRFTGLIYQKGGHLSAKVIPWGSDLSERLFNTFNIFRQKLIIGRKAI